MQGVGTGEAQYLKGEGVVQGQGVWHPQQAKQYYVLYYVQYDTTATVVCKVWELGRPNTSKEKE